MREMGARRTPSLIDALHARALAEVVEQDPWAGEDERWAAEDRKQEELARLIEAEVDEENILAPARAVIVGLILVAPLWLMIGGAGYAIYRVLS